MAANTILWGMATVVWAGVAASHIDLAASEYPARASKSEIAESCRAAGGVAWGMDEQQTGQYGCITSKGWIACDHHQNCTGGSGTTASREPSWRQNGRQKAAN